MKAFTKTPSLLILAAAFLIPGIAHTQGPINKPWGLGLCLGDPAGVTGKYWLSEMNALDAAVGYGFFPHKGVALYADYLFNLHKPIESGRVPFDLVFYIGVGGKLGFWHHKHNDDDQSGLAVGIRAPFGLTMLFTKAPFEVFEEITPSLAFGAPDPVWFDFDACLGGSFTSDREGDPGNGLVVIRKYCNGRDLSKNIRLKNSSNGKLYLGDEQFSCFLCEGPTGFQPDAAISVPSIPL